MNAAYDEAVNADDLLTVDGIGAEDQVFLFFIFAFFGIVVSVFGSFLAYVSYVEDEIMKDYVKNGIRIEGDVIATEFTRGVGRNDEGLIKFDSQKEYFVTVEYSLLISANYPVKVRKQLRVMEGEFHIPDDPDITQSRSHSLFQDPCSTCNSDMDEENCIIALQDPHQPTKTRIEIVTSTESFFKKMSTCHEKNLHLLALPNHPLSALPARQVEKRISSRHRLYSIMFVVAAITMAIFCYHVGAKYLLARSLQKSSKSVESFFTQERPMTRNGLLHLLYLGVALLPLPFIHCCLRDAIQNALQQEYFETGDIIRGGQDDDTSFSTWNTESLAGFKLSIGSLSTMA